MTRKQIEETSIERYIDVVATPQRAYRAVTSQTELRKWWAPRVIMAKNIVSHKSGKDMKMILTNYRENEFVRYKFYGLDWKDQPETIIAIEIHEKGVRRKDKGEGIRIHVYHEGWIREDYKKEYEEIWDKALNSLKILLTEEKIVHWWEKEKRKGDFKSANLQVIREFIQKMDDETKNKKDKKKASKILWQIFQELDPLGEWYCKDSFTEIEFYARGQKIFGALKSGYIVMSWRELEPILGRNLQDFADRFSIEQNHMEIHVGQNYEKIPAVDIIPDLFIRWCIDVIQHKNN
ncbi:MAG: SRPBCC domain-containing protein [Leptospiraceae bacterium]|nr:SRPBCC domain-containing protein [Leptospiraceae bacterium]MDW7976741.1 SRPBCC domain-containing protein [Leptospiraceae bacterium]